MNSIAFQHANMLISWAGITIVLGIVAGFFLSLALYSAHEKQTAGLCCALPFAIALSVFFSRILHWLCNSDQYSGFFQALTDPSQGSYCLPGALLGVWISAWLVEKLHLTADRQKILDAMAPGTALAFAFARLSSLFNTTCVSWILVKRQLLQRLPFAYGSLTDAGKMEYRFATFFWAFLLLVLFSAILLQIYIHRDRVFSGILFDENGHVFHMFLVLWSCMELVLDSTRYDASVLSFPGRLLSGLNSGLHSVGVTQIIAAGILISIMYYYQRRNPRGAVIRIALPVLFSVSLVGIFVCQVLVQRYTGEYLKIYLMMSVFSLISMLTIVVEMLTCRPLKSKEV